jgi:uncharacterized protein YhbP (UPF0306 family)
MASIANFTTFKLLVEMEAPDKRITHFINKHHIFTLATVSNGEPWCCTCFYIFDNQENRFIFTSDINTRHIAEGQKNHKVAGSIALETRIIGIIQGVQFSGTLCEMKNEEYDTARKLYLKRFPYAAPFLGSAALWSIEVSHLKMTDNKLGFGKKISWYRST